MSRSFTSGSTDRVIVATAAYDTDFTFGCWFYQLSQATGGVSPRIFDWATGSTGVHDVLALTGTDNLQCSVSGAVAMTLITTGNPLTPYATWRCIVWTGDKGSTAANYDLWLGTQQAAMAAPAFTPTNGSTPNGAATNFIVGNRPANDRGWNGTIARVFLVPWRMTLAEAERFRLGDWTVIYERGTPKVHLPLEGAGVYDLSGTNGLGSVTGTTVVADPPLSLWYPQASVVQRSVAAPSTLAADSAGWSVL